MNIFLEVPSHNAATPDLRHDDGVDWNAYSISLNRGSSTPLWLKAIARTIDFRRDDLERTHWRKLGRTMLDD